MSSAVEQIKTRLSIADVVGSYIKLEKAGGNFKAKCPFHNEKTPSFYVSPERESYHCFGCDKGGDIISFVEEMEGVDFIGALKILAEKAGVKLDENDKYEKSEKGRLTSLMNHAVDFFRKELVKNKQVLEYLKNRGLKGETVIKFKIGFAPDGWRSLYDYLKKLGYTEKEIESTGMTIKSPSGYYDRFRSRIMFPIMNLSGAPIGFSGRIFETKEAAAKAEHPPAKYINSPETILYSKSKALFGLDKAKAAIRQKNECVLVEGQVDLVMSSQAGVENVVAVSGTALTEDHLDILKRTAEKLTMAFDGDSAGLKASARAINMALSLGIEVRLAVLPNDMDPADVVLKNPADWISAVNNSKHIVDFFIDSIKNSGASGDKLAKDIEKQVLPYVASIKSKIEQAKFVNKITEMLGIGEAAVWEEVNKTKNLLTSEKNANIITPQGLKPPSKVTKKEEGYKQLIWAIFEWQKSKKEDSSRLIIDIIEKENKFKNLFSGEDYSALEKELSQKKNELILKAEICYDGASDLGEEVEHLLRTLGEELIRGRRDIICQQISLAQKNNDSNNLAKYMDEFQKLSAELEAFKKNIK